MSKTKRQNRYIPGLDGMRAMAVLAVIAYHIQPDLAPGGLMGVTIFFVLSGYLITNILLTEWEQHRRIDLKQFWIRRARRLLPAMYTMLIVLTAWVTLFDQNYLWRLREDFIAAALYISNWWYIFQDLSYFQQMEHPSLLVHFWSLAVEEQFYIVWPVILLIALSLKIKKRVLLILVLGAAAASAAAMSVLFEPGTDPSRIYYGTDTRVFSILIGAALAFVWPSAKLKETLPTNVRIGMDTAGGISLIAILILIWRVNEYDPFLYQGGMVILSLLTAILIAVLVHPASKLNIAMGGKIFRWIGTRSYGIYLWQYPILVLSTPAIQAGEMELSRVVLQITAILLLSELSYRLIETPIRHGAVKHYIQRVKERSWLQTISWTKWISAGCGMVIVCISTIGLAAPASEFKETAAELEQKEEVHIEKKTDKKPAPQAPDLSGEGDSETPITGNVTAIGDSVLIDAAPFLEKKFSNIRIDGKIGRQMHEVQDLLAVNKQEMQQTDYMVIALGSNGSFDSKKLIELLSTFRQNSEIFLVNVRVPRPWESQVNKDLQEVSKQHKNFRLVDWYKESQGHEEYFANDGVHLTKKGAEAYADLLERTIKQ